MEEIIIGSSTLIGSKSKEKIILNGDTKNIHLQNKVRFYESPYRIARKAIALNNKFKLKNFYSDEVFLDLIEVGALDTVSLNKIKNYEFEVLAGFVFESFVARRINAYSEIKKKALDWIITPELAETHIMNEIKAIAIGGVTTKREYPDLYTFSHPNIDILFLNYKGKMYPPIVDNFNRHAGVQVKAVKTNYKSQIVDKMIRYRLSSLTDERFLDSTRSPIYRRVLTLLKDNSGKHSYDICKDLIYSKYKDVIGKKEVEEAINHLVKPEMLGFDQLEIDYYYELISKWHKKPSLFKIQDLKKEQISSLKLLDSHIRTFEEQLPLRNHLILNTN